MQAPSKSLSLCWPVVLYASIRIGTAVVFVWSGISKLAAPQNFAIIIESYGLIPEATALPVAVLLASLELLAGAGLIFDVKYTLGIITGLLVLFMMILGYGISMGLDVDCGCFGPGDPEADAYHGLRPALYRDMVMLAAIGYLFYRRRRGDIVPLRFSNLFTIRTQRR